MNSYEHKEADIQDSSNIQEYFGSISEQERELVITSKGKMVGAILTEEQYNWFLDKLDEAQEVKPISDRASDLDGAQGLDEFKKELEK